MPVRRLLWFHTFKRRNVEDVIDVLRYGAGAAPPTRSRSTNNEQALGIAGPCVYAYLGQASPDFGNVAVALPQEAMDDDANISPFDSGGLVRHIAPVNGWEEPKKGDYLRQYTWQGTGLAARLADYPTPARLNAYIQGDRPTTGGPHAHWGGKEEAEIWSDAANTWQAWTWELRQRASLQTGSFVYRWSCPTTMHAAIREYAERNLDEVDFFERLLQNYVTGGVARLSAILRADQGAL